MIYRTLLQENTVSYSTVKAANSLERCGLAFCRMWFYLLNFKVSRIGTLQSLSEIIFQSTIEFQSLGEMSFYRNLKRDQVMKSIWYIVSTCHIAFVQFRDFNIKSELMQMCEEFQISHSKISYRRHAHYVTRGFVSSGCFP